MKDKFSSIDVLSVVGNIREKLIGRRVANIYDVDSKTYMITLSASNQEKAIIMIESGVRVHTTKYLREKSKIPSVFTLKLRKHIKSKRLEKVEQLGVDRVIDLTFGSGEVSCHILIELHSKGNIILTDYQYQILTLLRTYKYEESGVLIATKQIYPIADATQFTSLPYEKFVDLYNNFPNSENSTLRQFLSNAYGKIFFFLNYFYFLLY